MAKKEVITHSEIEKDIINTFKQPREMSESSYKKLTIPSVIIACLFVIIEFFYPIFILWLSLALFISVPVCVIISRIRLKHRIENVSLGDYDITTETVQNIAEEHYRAARGSKRRRTEAIHNYILYFENGESWHIPKKDNYRWSKERSMSAFGIYQSSHRGDAFIVVSKKDTGKIVMAYHTAFFEYQN